MAWAYDSTGKRSIEPVHAAQILLFQCESTAEVDDMLARLKLAGVDTIILRVFQNRHDRPYKFAQPKHKTGVYFKTDNAPVVDDVLEKVLPIAHKHGLKVFAWMTSRQTDWMTKKFPAWRDKKYDFKSRKDVTLDKIDLFNEDAQRLLLEVYRDLAAYDIDGILFQDDLVYRYTEGFSAKAKKAFENEMKGKVDPNTFYKKIVQRKKKYFAVEFYPRFWEWVRWKNRSILKFANRLSNAMKEKNPSIKTALNMYYETVMDTENGLAWLAQDFQESLKYDFDYFSVMAYHLQVKKALNLSYPQVYKEMETLSQRLIQWLDNPARAIVKVQIRDWQTGRLEKTERLKKVFHAITKNGKTSLAFIPCDKNTPLKTVQQYFKPERELARYEGPIRTSSN